MGSNFWVGMWSGILISFLSFAIASIVQFKSMEWECEEQHNVYDCTKQPTVFTPTPPEDT